MVSLINGSIHLVGYVPLVGSVIGGCRMALSGTAAIVNLIALPLFGLYGSSSEQQSISDNLGQCVAHFFTGAVEFVPFAKFVVKFSEICVQTEYWYCPGIFRS